MSAHVVKVARDLFESLVEHICGNIWKQKVSWCQAGADGGPKSVGRTEGPVGLRHHCAQAWADKYAAGPDVFTETEFCYQGCGVVVGARAYDGLMALRIET